MQCRSLDAVPVPRLDAEATRVGLAARGCGGLSISSRLQQFLTTPRPVAAPIRWWCWFWCWRWWSVVVSRAVVPVPLAFHEFRCRYAVVVFELGFRDHFVGGRPDILADGAVVGRCGDGDRAQHDRDDDGCFHCVAVRAPC